MCWLYFLLRLLEVTKNGGSYRDVCYGSGFGFTGAEPRVDNDDVSALEDEDVAAERETVTELRDAGREQVRARKVSWRTLIATCRRTCVSS